MSHLIFCLLFLSIWAKNNTDCQPKVPPVSDCKNISCFGAADCKLLNNKNPKCVQVVKNITVDDLIKINLNITDDDDWFGGNGTTNSTSSAAVTWNIESSLAIVITAQLYIGNH